MADRSLEELCDDVIYKVLHFAPSIWQLFQFELTSARFQFLTLDHMSKMTSVNLRTPVQLDETVVRKMEKLVCERFSRQLNKITWEPHSYGPNMCLIKEHPQLFPGRISVITEQLRAQYEDGAEESIETKIFRLLCDNSGWYWPDEDLKVIKYPDHLTLTAKDLKCFDFVDNCEDNMFAETLASVRSIGVECFEVENEAGMEKVFAALSIFTGLKYVWLILDYTFGQFGLQMAETFDRYITQSKAKIFISLDGVDIAEPVEDILKILGPHVWYCHLPTLSSTNTSHVSLLSGLRRMVFEGLPTDDLVLRALPESLTFLVLKDLDIESISSVKTFLEKRGEGLHTLSISLDDYQEMETSYLLEVIADKCVNLEYLRLHDAKDSPFSADELYQLIDKLGSKLIESRLTCHEVDFSLVEKIIPACNRLKYLHLILGGEGAVGKDTTWDKLKYMTKLVWAKIQTGTTQDSAITVNYKNQKWIYSSTPLDSSFFNVSDEDDELDYW